MTDSLVGRLHATILDPRNNSDLRSVDSLRASAVVEVLDTLDQQRRGLDDLVPAPTDDLRHEPPRWVHYPWRSALVHVLGPKGFRRLRLDRNRNKITAAEQDRLHEVKIGVVGLSVGHAVAHTLALEGLCGELRIADFDELELSNLNRIPSTVLDLGLAKTDVVARRIAELDPYLRVRVESRGITAETVDDFLDGLDIVVEECDSLDIKVLLREAARRHRIPVIMETSDRGLLDVERFDLEPDRPLFHGALGTLGSSELTGLTTHDKVPHVMSILGASELSAKLAASMIEVDRTVSTWPQLGSDVALGGATVATAVRRIALGRPLPSGRIRVDVEAYLDDIRSPELPTSAPAANVPHAETDRSSSVIESIADAARRAPSGGNVQPWTTESAGDRVVVSLDPARTTALDVAFRGSQVAVGAALFNARVAASHFGVGGVTEITESGDGRVHASLDTSSAHDPELAPMYDAMLARTTNRHSGTPAIVPESVIERLRRAAADEGASVVVVTDRGALTRIGELLAESDRMRYLTETLHAEMISELRWPGDHDPDTGIDVGSLALDATDLVKLDVSRRADVMKQLAEWDTGTALGDDTRDRMKATSAVALVMAPGVGAADHVLGGSAVERVWIQAEIDGLAVHPVSPTFIYAREAEDFESLSPRYSARLQTVRNELLDVVGRERNEPIALLLRLSHCTTPAIRSRRRPR